MTIYILNKKLIISTITIYISSLISLPCFGQLFGGNQNPLSVKWRQINSNGFKLIYPGEMENEAQRMANTISHIYPYVGKSLNRQKTSIPIILQNQGVTANGFVQLGPRKSEFYTTPPQLFDSQDWLNNLAVHELRHVAQFDKLTGGKARPFPEELYFAWFGVSLPLWFFEGDAVTIETALTDAGRGRQPSWIMPYRTSLLEGKKYSYSKVNFGSDKDLTPGYYQLGYLMTANMRKEFGKNIFDSLLTDIRKRPLRPYPFSNSLKKFTGKGSQEWFHHITDILTEEWKTQSDNTPSVSYPVLNRPAAYATSYLLPVGLKDGRILSLKQSKAEPPHFTLTDRDKTEQKLISIGPQEEPWFSYANGIIAWAEIRNDPRYHQRSYSVICTYNLETKKVNKLSSRSRLFAPSLSADGSKIVAVKFDLSNKCNLVEIGTANGEVLNLIPNPENFILQTPSYDLTGNLITYISVTEAGKGLWVTDTEGKTEHLISESSQQLSKPVYINDGIAFNAHYNGIDNIYYIDTVSKKISALSASKYGAFNPSALGDSSIIFNDYGLNGYQISETAIKLRPAGSTHFVHFGTEARKQENSGNVFNDIPDSIYTSSRYKTFSHLFNIHSLTPTIEDEYKGGLQLRSTNLLSTFDAFAGMEYARDLGRFEYSTGVVYKALYPILSATWRNRPRRAFYNSKGSMHQGDWRENITQLQASVPLSLNALNHHYSFSFSTMTSYTQRYLGQNMPENYIRTLLFPMQYTLSMTHSIRQAEREVAPQWAQSFRFSYIHQPFADNLAGRLYSFESFFYFPGLARNHNFLANFNYQNATGIRGSDTHIGTVYGYNNIKARDKLRNTLLLSYRFPIAFPDAEIGPLAYIRNLRGGLFCHYENIDKETNIGEVKTFGLELRSNMNLLRYDPIVEVGGRVIFVNKVYKQKPILELILNYSF